MGTLFAYSIQSSILLCCLYIIYKWLLASENQPGFNRVTLMGIYATALLMPLLTGISGSILSPVSDPEGMIEAGIPEAIVTGIAEKGTVNIYTILLYIYVSGGIFTLLRTGLTYLRLSRFVRNGEKENYGDYILVRTRNSGYAPFSWGRYIVIDEDMENDGIDLIMAHEEAHIRANHYADLIVSQLICVFQWFNPAAWLMQKELKAVHEYQADENVINSGCNAREYQLLLIRKAVGQRFPSLANSLNHSKLKNRITMMQTKKTNARRRVRVMALIPAAAFGFMLLGVPQVSEAMASASIAELSVPSVSDSKVNTNSPIGQETSAEVTEVQESAEMMPQFKGGMDAMFAYLIKNVRFPEDAKKADIQGTVVVRFSISEKGNVSDVTTIRSVFPSLDAEAIRVVESTDGMWIPGETDGKKVAVKFTLPISFKSK